MDFFNVKSRQLEKGQNKGKWEFYPEFKVGRSSDLMIRGGAFYAIHDAETGLWSTDEYDVVRLVDAELYKAVGDNPDAFIRSMREFSSRSWSEFRSFLGKVSDNDRQLDDKLTWLNTPVKRDDYVSKRLPYNLGEGDISAWDELMSTLYSPEERAKIEWAIGAIVSGDSRTIQKFLVFYGPAGTGKSTIINIISKMFEGYTATFEAKALGSNNGVFATEAFKSNPLVAIQHDGDLSKIEDNTRLNSIIAHEPMTMNEKYKSSYTSRVLAFLIMGTNQPVKISDAKSGIIRRLIDVNPSGVKIPPKHYVNLMHQVDFELGAIAYHCLQVYRAMGKNYYNTYRPLEMMFQTDIFFNFVEANFDVFKEQNGTTLKQAYDLYKQFCAETGIERPLPQYKVREELRNYFDDFHDRLVMDGVTIRSYYSGFGAAPFKAPVNEDVTTFSLVMDETISIFDHEYSEMAAQYANEAETPRKRWADVDTTLADLDTRELHYVRVPENHIVIDFDLKDDEGNKSLERNLEAASSWPATYAELSKSGSGVHLHYLYDGPVADLAREFVSGVEIKVYTGNSSLRRKLSKCNNVLVATLAVGMLPLKEKKVLTAQTIQSEKGLRDLIARNLRKEIHPGTKPSIDFIGKILDDAYLSGMKYDVTDLRSTLFAFANNSSNQSLACLKVVQKMKFASTPESESKATLPGGPQVLTDISQTTAVVEAKDERLVFYDIEVYPNLFVVCWKYEGSNTTVRMVNPTRNQIEPLLSMKLVGFNNRRYDNHILYAAHLGYTIPMLYALSKKIIEEKGSESLFGEAFNLSYADVYDFSSKKQGLKKFQIELGILHKEMDLPWDLPVEDKDIPRIVEYCVNDVVSLEAVFESRRQDYVARQILAELSGLTVNDTTQKHTAKIIFGEDRKPQSSFIYTKLDKEFPGYVFEGGKSTYRGFAVGEGGFVYAEPGIYEDVALLDVASMHPTSIEILQLFGDYTPRYTDLKRARLAIKHRDFEAAKGMLGGKLAPYLTDPEAADALSYALKIVINIVYGLTSAKFDNAFRDIRNKDNIVAKRGALFMIDLLHFVQERGFTVAHIKTDSIKIPNATPEIIQEVMLFGEKYGYTFEHEATYDKFCLVNDAVYIAKKDECLDHHWTAVGAQFQHPYVYKMLFGYEDDVTFNDFCETKQVSKGSIYVNTNTEQPLHEDDISPESMRFIGRTGRFVPVKPGYGGGILYRVQDEKKYAVAGTKGYLWVEADVALGLPRDAINMDYFEKLVDAAVKKIGEFGDAEQLIHYGRELCAV